MNFNELASNYLITLFTSNDNDEMTVEVELAKLLTDENEKLKSLAKEITRQLKDEILITPHVKLVQKGTLPQSEGKAVRVNDLRRHF
jgi:phenylacetate-CoA ligase